VVYAFRDLLAAASNPGNDEAIPEMLAEYNAAGLACRGASLDVSLVLLAALAVSKVLPATAKCAGCPFVGCTTYCFDFYKNPARCTAWTLRPGTKITYFSSCTWTVDSIQKDVCACYPGRWKRFWAYGACDEWVVERVVTTRTVTADAEQFSRFGPPNGDPNNFKVETSC
jgi:hypothetical protein